jgi:sulfide:quinone oxidoreductase
MMNARADSLHVVIAGGGVAALEATLVLRALAQEPLSIELIAPERDFVYRPLAVTAPFHAGETRTFPLAQLAEEAGGRLSRGRVVAVDRGARMVLTSGGVEHPYDVLLVAVGARAREAVPNARTFSGPSSEADIAHLLDEALGGEVRRIVYAVPAGVAWSLPAYELALMTRSFLVDRGSTRVEIVLVTPEDHPLALFGPHASDAMAELLETRGITCRLQTVPLRFGGGALHVAPRDEIEADRVVSLARLTGPRLAGLPCDAEGFLSTDGYCRVAGEPDVYAAGDATQFPLKQGGIAAQQADVAATDIALRTGSTVEPRPFRPVLRGLLVTGMAPRFLRAEPGSAQSSISTEALWWPPAKIVGRYLAPFLASRLGLSTELPREQGEHVPVEVELDPSDHAAWSQV